MLVGFAWMAKTYSINQKQSIILLVYSDSLILSYTAPTLPLKIKRSDTLMANQTLNGNFTFLGGGDKAEANIISDGLAPNGFADFL